MRGEGESQKQCRDFEDRDVLNRTPNLLRELGQVFFFVCLFVFFFFFWTPSPLELVLAKLLQ